MKHNSYVKARFFERLIAEIEQSVEQMEDNDLERIIFMCWGAQQSRREDNPHQKISFTPLGVS